MYEGSADECVAATSRLLPRGSEAADDSSGFVPSFAPESASSLSLTMAVAASRRSLSTAAATSAVLSAVAFSLAALHRSRAVALIRLRVSEVLATPACLAAIARRSSSPAAFLRRPARLYRGTLVWDPSSSASLPSLAPGESPPGESPVGESPAAASSPGRRGSRAVAFRTAARVTPKRAAMSAVLLPAATSAASSSRSILVLAVDLKGSREEEAREEVGSARAGTTASRPWGWMRALPRICSSSLASCHRSDATPIASPGTGALAGLRDTGRPRRRFGRAEGVSDDGAFGLLEAPSAPPRGRSGSAVRTLGAPDAPAPPPRSSSWTPRVFARDLVRGSPPFTPPRPAPPIARLDGHGFRTTAATPRLGSADAAESVHRTRRHRACVPELASVDMTLARSRAPALSPRGL